MTQKYATVADLASDHSFIQWVKYNRPEEGKFWEIWLQENPGMQQSAKEARELVLMLAQDTDQPLESELEQIWKNISVDHLALEPRQTKPALVLSKKRKQRSIVVAALSLVLLIAAVAIFWLMPQPTVTYAAAYGEKKVVRLSDNSLVTLNANSKITVPEAFEEESAREVELEGEAYFSVTHQQKDQPFWVKTKDGLRVEVLGTEFVVSDRGETSRVVLASGKVQLCFPENANQVTQVMQPGEMIEVAEASLTFEKKRVNPEVYTSWKDNKVIFDNTSLQEVATLLQETYGYPVEFKDAALKNLRVTASLTDNSLQGLLATLSETFNLSLTVENQKIIIDKK